VALLAFLLYFVQSLLLVNSYLRYFGNVPFRLLRLRYFGNAPFRLLCYFGDVPFASCDILATRLSPIANFGGAILLPTPLSVSSMSIGFSARV
jgi:hypothetical protein